MGSFLAQWAAAAFVFVALDAAWLTQAGPRLYKPLIGELLAEKVSLAPAVAFYLIYVTGLVVLAVQPALERGGLARALLLGAVTGLVAYGAYDLTNHATLKVWDLRITLADMAWGAFVSAVAAGGAYLAGARLATPPAP